MRCQWQDHRLWPVSMAGTGLHRTRLGLWKTRATSDNTVDSKYRQPTAHIALGHSKTEEIAEVWKKDGKGKVNKKNLIRRQQLIGV